MSDLSTCTIKVGWKRKLGAKCKDVLLTLRFYSQKPFFVTALPAGSARSGETTKRAQRTVGSPRAHGKASPNWSSHPEPLTNSLTTPKTLTLNLTLNISKTIYNLLPSPHVYQFPHSYLNAPPFHRTIRKKLFRQKAGYI